VANLGLENSIMVFTGGLGTGKTIAASSYLPPSKVGRVFYLDMEGSANRVVEQLARRDLAFGYYKNLDDEWRSRGLPGQTDLLKSITSGNLPWVDRRQQNTLITIYDIIMKELDDNITPGKFDVVVFDPVGRFEAAMQAFVEANKQNTGWNRKAFGGMWREGFYPLYRGLFSAIHDRGVKVIILTAHLGNPWTDEGPVPGKVRPKAKPELYKICQFYGWLVNDTRNADGAPACVVLKSRLGVTDIDLETDTWKHSQRIPNRVPHFTWDDVERYLKTGCDLANPAAGETLTAEEREMISDGLSTKQMELMIARAQTALATAQGASFGDPSASNEMLMVDPKSTAIKLYAEGSGATVQQIAEQLSKPPALVKVWVDA